MKTYFWRLLFHASVRKGFPKIALGSGFLLRLLPLFLLASIRANAGGTVTVCTSADLAAALSGGGVVTFGCDGVILLTNTITISANTTLDAAGHAVTLSGGNRVRLFNVNAGASLTLVGLRLADGSGSNGGAVFNHGTLNASNCTFIGNQALATSGANGLSGQAGFGAAGGAVWNEGRFTVSRSAFTSNTVWGGDGGSGSNNGGDGGAGGNAGAAFGGAIFNQGVAYFDRASFQNNRALGGVGGMGGTGARTDNPLQSAHSGGSGGAGGQAAGGAIYNGTNSLTITRSLFADNSALGGAGGAAGAGNTGYDTPGGNGGGGGSGGLASGGAIQDQSGDAGITNSTFAANSVTGGVGGAGGNGAQCSGGRGGGNAGGGGSGGNATGGAVSGPASAVLSLSHDTLSANNANRGSRGLDGVPGAHCSSTGGGLIVNPGTNGVSAGGALFSAVSSGSLGFNFQNTILAGNLSGGNCAGTVFDGGHNISSDGTCQFSSRSTSLNNTDAKLGPLTFNGGPTLTFPLLAGSPAINAVSSSAPPTDQRGVLRPQGGQADIGAYEFTLASLTLKPAGALHLVFSAVPGQTCALQSSSDMLVWEPQPAEMTATNGMVSFDVAAPNTSARFFRTVTSP